MFVDAYADFVWFAVLRKHFVVRSKSQRSRTDDIQGCQVGASPPPPLPPVGLKLQQLCEFIDWVFGGYFADSYTEAFLRSWGIVRGIQRDPLTF